MGRRSPDWTLGAEDGQGPGCVALGAPDRASDPAAAVLVVASGVDCQLPLARRNLADRTAAAIGAFRRGVLRRSVLAESQVLGSNAQAFLGAGLGAVALWNLTVSKLPCDRGGSPNTTIDLELTGATLVDGPGPQMVFTGAVDLRLE